MSDTVYQINNNIIYHEETSVKHANSSPESQNEYRKRIEEAVNKEKENERLTCKRQATAERKRKYRQRKREALKENETDEQLKRRRKILAERQRNYRKGKREEAPKKNETDEQLKLRRKILAEKLRNYRKGKREEAAKNYEANEQLKRRRKIIAERQRNYRKCKRDEALKKNETDEQLKDRRKILAERQRNYRKSKLEEAIKKNETDEQLKRRRQILAERQRNYRKGKCDDALNENERDEQLKRRRKMFAERQRNYRNKREEAHKKNETDEQHKRRRKILAEKQRNYRNKRDEALKKKETDEQLKRRREILAEKQRNYRKRKRKEAETANDMIEDSDIVMSSMADLNQGDLASYLIKELIGSSTTAQPVNRISQLLEELRQALNGVSHPRISYESALPEFNAQFLNPFPDPDLFRYNEERVRSRTYRAPCCDVTLIALHAPQCQRYGTQARLSSHQPASTNTPHYLAACHNTLPGGIDASSCYAPLPSNHTLPTPKTNSSSGDQIRMPLITPALTTKINVSPLEYVVDDSSWSSEDRIPIKVEVPEKAVVNNLTRNSHRACKNKKSKTLASYKRNAIWDENKAKQANALIEEATNHEGDDFSNYSVRRMSERLGVSRSSLYKYLKLTRPETEGGPRKVLNLVGRRGLTESSVPTSATYTEFNEYLYKLLEKEEALTVKQIRERLPLHLLRTNQSIIKNLKRMNCVRRSVSAITASKNILAIQARSGGCHNVSGYWSLNRAKSSVKEKPAVEVTSVSNKTFLKNDQVIMVRKAYADCILSLSQSTTADLHTKFGDATFLKSLIFVSYKRYPIELIPKGIDIEGTASSQKEPILEIFVTLSVKGVMDYAVNIVNNGTSQQVANTFVPFVRHTVDLINRARFINNLVSLVLVVDRGTCPDVEIKLDDARSNMTFKDPSHSLIYLPPASNSLNPISQFMHDMQEYVRSNYPFTSSSNGEASSAKAAALGDLSSSYIKAVANHDFTPLYENTQKYICMAANYEYF